MWELCKFLLLTALYVPLMWVYFPWAWPYKAAAVAAVSLLYWALLLLRFGSSLRYISKTGWWRYPSPSFLFRLFRYVLSLLQVFV